MITREEGVTAMGAVEQWVRGNGDTCDEVECSEECAPVLAFARAIDRQMQAMREALEAWKLWERESTQEAGRSLDYTRQLYDKARLARGRAEMTGALEE